MDNKELAQQSWRDERCPCENGDEQGCDLGAREQRGRGSSKPTPVLSRHHRAWRTAPGKGDLGAIASV